MLGLFVILLVITLVAAKFAAGKHDTALKLGSRKLVPGAQTAAEAAREFLDENGASDVQIREHTAMISDYFDPARRTLFLNRTTLNGTDLGSWAATLHEAAHATQVGDSASALKWRLTSIRMTRYLPTIIGLIAILFIALKRLPPGIALRLCAVLLALIMLMNVMSLPVEFNASNRALAWLERKLRRHPDTIDAITPILRNVAFRDTGAFLRSPMYCLFGLLPIGGKSRPKK
ncbi:zinc metallopeptidase [Phragmitibacter flavus]|nr:zinc metallopeptidase [Phragmitibacter flavus]